MPPLRRLLCATLVPRTTGLKKTEVFFGYRDAIYVTDGTADNTAVLKELSGSTRRVFPEMFQSELGMLVGSDELWIDDTEVELNDATEWSLIDQVSPFEDGFVFEDDYDIFTTDGETTTRLTSRWERTNFASFSDPIVMSDLLFLKARHRDGTSRIAVTNGTDSPTGVWRGSHDRQVLAAAKKLFILDADEGTIWVTAGDKAQRVYDIPRDPDAMDLVATSTEGVFIQRTHIKDGNTVYDLWFTDGETSARVVANKTSPARFSDHQGRRMMFEIGKDTWTTDGTQAGTMQIGNSTEYPVVADALELHGKWFELIRLSGESELVTYDSETMKVLDRLSFDARLYRMFAMQGQLYLLDGSTLWTSDGSYNGTSMVAEADLWGLSEAGGAILAWGTDPTGQTNQLFELTRRRASTCSIPR